ncbi:MAG TPA: AbrB/MazE/SpoVT family DNA-binding domain-containing protein [Clostridia bacterium]|nr:AbrB/MazE/SpoVT family DNA-binding domain-containing protein [Clostridia bacterium]
MTTDQKKHVVLVDDVGRITIPAEVRLMVGLKKLEDVVFRVEDNKLILARVEEEDY